MSMLDTFLKSLKGEQEIILESFVEKPCNDMAEYNRRVGQYFGLKTAEEQLLTLVAPKEDD